MESAFDAELQATMASNAIMRGIVRIVFFMGWPPFDVLVDSGRGSLHPLYIPPSNSTRKSPLRPGASGFNYRGGLNELRHGASGPAHGSSRRPRRRRIREAAPKN